MKWLAGGALFSLLGCAVSLERGSSDEGGGGAAATTATTGTAAVAGSGGDAGAGSTATSSSSGGGSSSGEGGGGGSGGATTTSTTTSGGPCGRVGEACCDGACDDPTTSCDGGVCLGCVTDLVAGEGSTGACATVRGGGAVCWGRNEASQIVCGGVGAYAPTAIDEAGSAHVADVASHVCAVGPGGTAVCWGENDAGQCGQPDATAVVCPVSGVVLPSAVAEIEVTDDGSTVALLDTGEVYGWGSNHYGQLGFGGTWDDDAHPDPALLAIFDDDNLGIAAGNRAICALKADRTVRCMGDNQELALGTDGPVGLGVLVTPDVDGVDEIVAGTNFFCARSGAQVRCWGDNYFEQLGSQGDANIATPTLVPLPGAAVQVSAGHEHACALLDDATVTCWGANDHRQIGRCESSANFPTQVFLDAGATEPLLAKRVVAGGQTTCAIDLDDRSICWGANQFYQVGIDNGFVDVCPPAVTPISCP